VEKTWLFQYYWVGKQKRMSLGSYPQINLKEVLIEGAALICVLEGRGDVDPAFWNAVGSYVQLLEASVWSPGN
jgi:hypothetical protein